MRLLRVGFLLALLVAAPAVVFYTDTRLPLRDTDKPALVLDVPPGMRADGIARELYALGLVRHPLVFRALVHERGAGTRLRAGRYTLEPQLSLVEILRLLERGEAERHEVTFPEGKSLDEVATIAAAAGLVRQAFLDVARDPGPIRDLDPDAKDLEGYLFPDTYDVPQGGAGARALVARMLQRFRTVIAAERPRIAASGLSVRKLVTLASLVELETARPDERPRIAAVFLNRLSKGMLLQTDPTVIYVRRQAGNWDGNLRKKDLELDSRYNTYRYPGLPPGPIASPGRASLRAVLEPASGRELYFVSRNDGTHQFSESLREHELAVDRYQRHRARTAAAPTLPAPRR